VHLTTEVSLDKVYDEVKRVRLELKSIEKSLDSLVESLIPTEKISPAEAKELRAIEAEMDRGEYVTLEEVKRKYGAKKRAKVPNRSI
jgi:hypothetical protein